MCIRDSDSPERARNEIRAACRRLSTRDPWKAFAPAVFRDLVEGLISTVFGLGPLEDLIADETVTEIMVNGTDSVYIERDGRLSRASVSFESDEQVRALIDRILGPLGRRVDESSPMASARLPQGHRVNVVLPPLSLNGPLLTIRAFTRRVMTLAELKARGSFDETVEQFLIWAVGSVSYTHLDVYKRQGHERCVRIGGDGGVGYVGRRARAGSGGRGGGAELGTLFRAAGLGWQHAIGRFDGRGGSRSGASGAGGGRAVGFGGDACGGPRRRDAFRFWTTSDA